MKTPARRWVALGVLGGSWLAATMIACGSDDTTSDGPDASTEAPETSTSSSSGEPGDSIAIVVADLTVYLGSTAALDASQTNATGFAWAVKKAPQGSTVTSAALTSATTPRAAFVPDVGGEYEIEVTAQRGGAQATKTVKVKAVAAPLFFMQTNFNEDPPYFEYRTIGNDESNNHPIACRSVGPEEDKEALGGFAIASMFFADVSLDWWEAPPGSPSRVAFTTFQIKDAGAGSLEGSLAVGTTESTCQNPPVAIAQIPEDGGAPKDFSIMQPRFSPDGARVAYIEKRQSGSYVATVAWDGKDRRDIARLCPAGDNEDSCSGFTALPARPQWLDRSTVVWARKRSAGGAGWEIVRASDSANPSPRVHMTCAGDVPRGIAILKDGTVLANPPSSIGIEDLLVLRPSSPGGECALVRNLTNLTIDAWYARDFAVSPDETEVAFVRKQSAGELPDAASISVGGELWIAPIDGSAPAKPFGGGAAAYAFFGPRFIASASQLVWTGAAAAVGLDASIENVNADAGVPALTIASRDGGRARNLIATDVDAGSFVVSGGNGGSCGYKFCSFGGAGAASTGGALATAGFAVAFLFRRRRRS